MEVHIKSLVDCTYSESLTAWNESWTGYFFDMRLDLKRFLSRFERENLHPEASFIAFQDQEPVGFVMNGIEDIKGQRVGWVGGIAVAPAARKYKVGEALMNKSLSTYAELGVDVARLEVIRVNDKALRLYQKLGYEVIDELTHLSCQLDRQHTLDFSPFDIQSIRTANVYPHELAQLSFYNTRASWQTQWLNIKGAEGMIASDQQSQTLGYALFRIEDKKKGLRALNVYQCELHPQVSDPEQVVVSLLEAIVNKTKPNDRIMLTNFSTRKESLMKLLRKLGFNTYVEQYHMEKVMANK
jgi:ribosomal protein S18 acetylase RimI-like enzyme